MDIEEQLGRVALIDILTSVGFTPTTSDKWQFDFGNLKLEAWLYLGAFGAIQFYGVWSTSTSAAEVEFKQPLFVDSFEQGVALIANSLRRYQLTYTPEWIARGFANEDLLPWMIERAAFEKIPKAEIDQQYFRLIIKKLKTLYLNVHGNTPVVFSFDEQVFKIVCDQEVILSPAKGQRWQQDATILVSALAKLPKRITYNSYSVYIHNGNLQFGNYAYCLSFPEM